MEIRETLYTVRRDPTSGHLIVAVPDGISEFDAFYANKTDDGFAFRFQGKVDLDRKKLVRG